MVAKFTYVTKMKHRNAEVEMGADTRRTLLHRKIKLGWQICRTDDVVQGMGNKKALGEDGIPSEEWKCLVATLPRYLTEIYNGCLKEDIFPKRWKKAKIIPIVKPGKEGSEEVNKFRPISLHASGCKVLEKLLINRINHHVFSRGYMNDNQFGFRPQ